MNLSAPAVRQQHLIVLHPFRELALFPLRVCGNFTSAISAQADAPKGRFHASMLPWAYTLWQLFKKSIAFHSGHLELFQDGVGLRDDGSEDADPSNEEQDAEQLGASREIQDSYFRRESFKGPWATLLWDVGVLKSLTETVFGVHLARRNLYVLTRSAVLTGTMSPARRAAREQNVVLIQLCPTRSLNEDSF